MTVTNLAVSQQISLVGILNTKLEAPILNSEISSTAGITSNKLAIQQNYKKSSIASPSATANTAGTTVSATPVTNYVSMFPQGIDVVFGGTFGTETVTATVKVTYGDVTTATATKTATAVGTSSFTNTDLMSLIKDATYIKQIDVYSQSTIASSASTITFNHCGFYL